MRIPCLLLALTLAAPAAAQEPVDESDETDEPTAEQEHDRALGALTHDATLTFSPLLVALPIGCEEVAPGPETPGRNCPNWTIELTGEFPFVPHHTGSLIAGFGWRVTDDGLRRSTTVGGQYRYYPFSAFHGFHVGLEGMRQDFTLATTVSAVHVGPLIGYKLVAPFGLTTDIQVGGAARFARERVEGTFLLNVGLGWSFDLSPDK